MRFTFDIHFVCCFFSCGWNINAGFHRPFVIGGHPAFASGFDLVVCCGVLFLGVEKRMGMKVKGADISNN